MARDIEMDETFGLVSPLDGVDEGYLQSLLGEEGVNLDDAFPDLFGSSLADQTLLADDLARSGSFEQVASTRLARRSSSSSSLGGPVIMNVGPLKASERQRAARERGSAQGDARANGEGGGHQRGSRAKAPLSSHAAAQRRFVQRQKDKRERSKQQLEELTQRVAELMSEKEDLQHRNHAFHEVLYVHENHVALLFSNKVVRMAQQTIMLKALAEMMCVVYGRCVMESETRAWTLGEWMELHFPAYIQKLRDLCRQGDQAQLQRLAALQRERERPGATFTSMHWALFCWNREETQRQGTAAPATHLWANILDELRLSREQAYALLEAQNLLLASLDRITRRRADILSGLGLRLLQNPQEDLLTCEGSPELRANIRAERSAVVVFLMTILDETLTVSQEASLDMLSFPSCPDILALCNELALRLGEPGRPCPAMPRPEGALREIFPNITALELLRLPIAAHGIGSRLKLALAISPYITAAPRCSYPSPGQDVLRDMPLYQVHCGAWKRWSFWEWKTECMQAGGRLLENTIPKQPRGFADNGPT